MSETEHNELGPDQDEMDEGEVSATAPSTDTAPVASPAAGSAVLTNEDWKIGTAPKSVTTKMVIDTAKVAPPPSSAPRAKVAPPPPPTGLEKKWYVVHTYSGYENKARQTLEERIKRESFEEYFGQILIPTEEIVEMKRGKRRTSKRKFFPGYMLVQMAMTEATWYLVKSTPKITGFVGDSTNPPPVLEEEVLRITRQIGEGAERATPKMVFEKGDAVRVVDGPFANFNGVVEEVETEKGKLRVLVSIFGRATPVEMDFVQVEKT